MGTVSLQGIEKFYGNTKVIHGVDMQVNDGEFLVFVGPSGCGKSTILRMIAGLEDISGGVLAINGEAVNDVPPARRGTAMVFQNYALYPHMTVAENMGFALKLAGTPKDQLKTSVGRAAEILRISHLLERKPKALSSASAWPSAAPSCASRQCSSSTSRCPTSMPPCACRCAWSSPACTASSARR